MRWWDERHTSGFDMFTKWQGSLVAKSEGKGSVPVST